MKPPPCESEAEVLVAKHAMLLLTPRLVSNLFSDEGRLACDRRDFRLKEVRKRGHKRLFRGCLEPLLKIFRIVTF